jgi:hypothetical protein
VNRREPTTGEVLWTYELAAPNARAADGSPIEMIEGMAPRAFGGETGDWLAAGIQGGGIVLLAADGRVERELAPRGATFMDLFRVGVTAVDGRLLATQTDEGTQVTTDLVSGTVFPGLSVGQAAVVDDGSIGAVVLSLDADGRLTLTDLTSGAAWSAPGVGAFSGWWYVLDERVLVRGERTIAAYDGASGTELWRAPLRTWSSLGDQGTFIVPPTDTVPLTDGRSILTVEPGDSLGSRVLVATSVRDGQRSWEVPVADDVIGIKEMGGRPYALLEDGGIAALG